MIRLSKIKVSDFSQWSFFFLSLHMNCSVCLISCFFCHLRWDWMLPDLSKVIGLLCSLCLLCGTSSFIKWWENDKQERSDPGPDSSWDECSLKVAGYMYLRILIRHDHDHQEKLSEKVLIDSLVASSNDIF